MRLEVKTSSIITTVNLLNENEKKKKHAVNTVISEIMKIQIIQNKGG